MKISILKSGFWNAVYVVFYSLPMIGPNLIYMLAYQIWLNAQFLNQKMEGITDMKLKIKIYIFSTLAFRDFIAYKNPNKMCKFGHLKINFYVFFGGNISIYNPNQCDKLKVNKYYDHKHL